MKIIKCGIYKLYFKEHHKCYIGSSVNIYKRFRTHIQELKRKVHCNIHLQRIYDKTPSILIEIIEECNEKILHEREEFYINLYKNIAVNINPKCGRPPKITKKITLKNYMTDEIITKNSHIEFENEYNLKNNVGNLLIGRNKTIGDFCLPEYIPPFHIAKSPNGILYKIYKHRIKEFAIKNNLKPDILVDMLNKKIKQCQGWILPSTTVSTQTIQKSGVDTTSIIRKYQLINPNNELIDIYDLSQFIIENNLDKNKIREIIYCNKKEYNGWRSPNYKPKRIWNIKSPDGIIYNITSIKEFCLEHNLSKNRISTLLRGYNNQHKGWTRP